MAELRVLVTGASGFIGHHLIGELLKRSISVGAVSRHFGSVVFADHANEVAQIHSPGLNLIDWTRVLEGYQCVVHLAAQTRPRDNSRQALDALEQVNVDLTRVVAKAAKSACIERFVFLSSIGVHGDESGETPFTHESSFTPHNPYTQSKLRAEWSLREILSNSTTGLTIIRPPLVYGLGAVGTFRLLRRAVALGVPLPLRMASVNRRSFVSVDNLIDLIALCLRHPAALNQTFLVSDGKDLSTFEFISKLGHSLGRPARLFDFPLSSLRSIGGLLGFHQQVQSLLASLWLDVSSTTDRLGWLPPVDFDDGLKRAVGNV